MNDIFKSAKFRILLIILAVILGLVSFFAIGEKAASPETFRSTMESLDQKKITVAEMTAVTTGTSVAIAAVPGDATTPIANKMADFSGYLLMITALILCEKYLLTLSGMLAFKILIPVALGAFAVYLISGWDRFRWAAARIAVFAIAFFLVVPASVYVSDIIEDTYVKSSEYTIEQAKEDQAAIEAKAAKESEDGKWYDKITSKVTSGFKVTMDKAENMINRFIDFIAVMAVTNLVIPIAVFFILLNLLKSFTGRDYGPKAVSGAKKMNCLIDVKKQ